MEIIYAMLEKGYDPYAQLEGYLQENNPLILHITEMLESLYKP